MRHRHRSIALLLLTLASIAAASVLALSQILPHPVSERFVSVASAPVESTPAAFLPLVARSGGAEEPALTIYDLDGAEQDGAWLVATFGAVTLERGTGTASVRVLRAVEGPSTLVVRIEDAGGNPLENVPVVVHWPDAPQLPPEQQACGLDRGLVIPTKDNGNAEFGMGPGAYYFPPAGGPHVVWVVAEGTDCLGGLGMLGGTNHIHLDSVWTLP